MKDFYVYEYYIVSTQQVFYVGKGRRGRITEKSRNKDCLKIQSENDWGYRKVYTHLTDEEALAKEMELIAYYKSFDDNILTNKTKGGDGGWYHSVETRKMISERNTGVNNPNYGNRWSREKRDKLSKTLQASSHNKGGNNVRAHAIMCIETGVVYSHFREAMSEYNIKYEGSISVCLEHVSRTAGGVHWVSIKNPKDELYWNNKSNRDSLLSQIYSNKNVGIRSVCMETREIFNSIASLKRYLNSLGYNVGDKKLRKELKNNKTIIIDNLTFKLID